MLMAKLLLGDVRDLQGDVRVFVLEGTRFVVLVAERVSKLGVHSGNPLADRRLF